MVAEALLECNMLDSVEVLGRHGDVLELFDVKAEVVEVRGARLPRLGYERERGGICGAV